MTGRRAILGIAGLFSLPRLIAAARVPTVGLATAISLAATLATLVVAVAAAAAAATVALWDSADELDLKGLMISLTLASSLSVTGSCVTVIR